MLGPKPGSYQGAVSALTHCESSLHPLPGTSLPEIRLGTMVTKHMVLCEAKWTCEGQVLDVKDLGFEATSTNIGSPQRGQKELASSAQNTRLYNDVSTCVRLVAGAVGILSTQGELLLTEIIGP